MEQVAPIRQRGMTNAERLKVFSFSRGGPATGITSENSEA
jgi:hypothetical protein